MRLGDLQTPALVADRQGFDANVATMAARWPGAALRPHVKAFKSTALAAELVAAGHHAFCAATVREVLGMAAAGLGADLLLRTAYAPGDWPHELRVLDPEGRAKAGAAEPWTVLGPLCFAGDVVARDRMLPPIEEGDLVVVRDTGGYTTSMWSRYCSRTMPAVAGLRGAAPRLEVLRPREDGADIVHFWRGREPGTAAG